MGKKNIAVFASGEGSNCENLIRYFSGSDDIRVALVLSNRTDAYALVRARELGVPSMVVTKVELNDESVMLPLLRKYDISMIVLAGFLPIIPDFLVNAYTHRIVNIHPSLLPRHGGKGMWGHHVHEAVKAAGDTETGMTVHYVSSVCDGGEIIVQYSVPLSPDDTPDDIAEKEHELEMKYYPAVIEQLLEEL
ncbi:MAG: phosphoribosylglycinamide formyltransferase [Bacteroidaceae bacterium]|nr:phosphoribosylglycinamide formyltransferase [Bacteroidaceae bacterium]